MSLTSHAEEHARGTNKDVRDGSLLHSLQAAAGPSDPDAADGAEHVLQAEELQDGCVLRAAAAGAGTETGSGPTGEENTTGLRKNAHRRTPAVVRRAQSVQYMRDKL